MKMDKLFGYAGTILLGVAAGFGFIYLYEKRKEKKMGGKLMRVNYRFTKDFDD